MSLNKLTNFLILRSGGGSNMLMSSPRPPLLLRCSTTALLEFARGAKKKAKKQQQPVKRKPRHSEETLFDRFVDTRNMRLRGGQGGDGSSLFHRDKNTAFGGPSGGSGGKGADVWIRADRTLSSLQSLKRHYSGERGDDGGGKFHNGRSAKPLVVRIPVGTRLVCNDTGDVLKEFCLDGEMYLACVGGHGGKGNMFFKSSTNNRPDECTEGALGETKYMYAELQLIADVGLVGFPNAGKSTLLRGLSRAKPLVAEYAFTTLVPHVGIVDYEDHERVAVADIPGLVEGAHKNEGLGFQFLRHVKRCRFLAYVCDLSHDSEPWRQVDKLKYELDMFEPGLADRVQLVIANKLDLPKARDNYEAFCAEVAARHDGLKVVPLSGMTKQNIESLTCHLRDAYDSCEKSRFDCDTPWWKHDAVHLNSTLF